MDKATLEDLKNTAEQRCRELFNQVEQTQVELERTRGDFRTYESLLSNWVEQPEVIEPKSKKVKE